MVACSVPSKNNSEVRCSAQSPPTKQKRLQNMYEVYVLHGDKLLLKYREGKKGQYVVNIKLQRMITK